MKVLLDKMAAILLAFVILATSLTSCSSTTRIESYPSDAKVYVDGALKGTTPYDYKDFAVSGAIKQIEIKKEGYEDFQATLKKNERAHGWAIVGGIFLLFPFIWVVQYEKEHNYELTPAVPGSN